MKKYIFLLVLMYIPLIYADCNISVSRQQIVFLPNMNIDNFTVTNYFSFPINLTFKFSDVSGNASKYLLINERTIPLPVNYTQLYKLYRFQNPTNVTGALAINTTQGCSSEISLILLSDRKQDKNWFVYQYDNIRYKTSYNILTLEMPFTTIQITITLFIIIISFFCFLFILFIIFKVFS